MDKGTYLNLKERKMKTPLPIIVFALSTLTLADVIPISTFEELAKIGHDPAFPLNGHYKLMNDIDASPSRLTGVDDWNLRGWITIGRWWVYDRYSDSRNDSAFSGVFDGNYKSIRGLYCNYVYDSECGLFGAVRGRPGDSAVVKNLHVEVD